MGDSVNRRLLYDAEQDIYFFVYSILLILDEFNCYSKEKAFVDYRKLSFIIIFISNNININIYECYYKGRNNINKNIKKKLKFIYERGIGDIQFLRYVLLIMEKNNLIKLFNEVDLVNVSIVECEKNNEFINKTIFRNDRENIKKLIIPRSKIERISYKKFIENIFKMNGVTVWEE